MANNGRGVIMGTKRLHLHVFKVKDKALAAIRRLNYLILKAGFLDKNFDRVRD
jgi:hypothetical protein